MPSSTSFFLFLCADISDALESTARSQGQEEPDYLWERDYILEFHQESSIAGSTSTYCLFGRFILSVSPMGKAVVAVAAKGSKATPKNARVPTDITTELVVSCAAVVALLFLPLIAIIPYVRAKGPSWLRDTHHHRL